METVDNLSIDRPQLLPIKMRWRLVLVALCGTMIFRALGIIQIIKLNKMLDSYYAGDAGAMEMLVRGQATSTLDTLIGYLSIAFMLFAVIAVCLLIHRLAENVYLAGVPLLNYSPGWHVGWFFIPFVQLVMPFLTMRELWKANNVINNKSRFDNWMGEGVSPFLNMWYFTFLIWVIYLVYVMFSAVGYVQRIAVDPDALAEYMRLIANSNYITVPIAIIEGVLLLLFCSKMVKTQEELINS